MAELIRITRETNTDFVASFNGVDKVLTPAQTVAERAFKLCFAVDVYRRRQINPQVLRCTLR
ncbi:MAG: hypothetical protein JNM79_19000 [Burkholderiales bacterium]|nr:hypothetical protein [Burkholderiales bacterium]